MHTPLAGIVGASDVLAGDAPHAEVVRHELVQQIRSSALEPQLFVENPLDMSRLESGLLEPRLDRVDVSDLIQTAAGKTRDELSDHTVAASLSDDQPLFKLDHVLLEQVLMNLLRKSARYTPAGTTVRIAARIDGDALELVVEDNGAGFPDEALPRLFDKFFRVAKTHRHGIGLGLSIAKGFVEAHGGSIAAENRSGGGARFVIRIPALATV